ncbi:MAG: hypothetical protein MUO57_19445, partial [Anaerolineales bacterium]|nr:hypothetical protein [Anaerolineales bacterium]
ILVFYHACFSDPDGARMGLGMRLSLTPDPKRSLLARARALAGCDERGLEGIDVLVVQEQAKRGINLGLPGVIGHHTVSQTADHSVAGPVIHGRF